MSWSVQLIGKASNVAQALDKENLGLNGQSKVEWDEAVPIIKAVLAQNFGVDPDREPVVKLDANGSGCAVNGGQQSRSMKLLIEPTYTKLV